MNILGICGEAGSGKGAVATILTDNFPTKVVEIALADPMKRFAMQTFGFTEGQLWGPSERRGERSPLYPDGPAAREVLQQLGTGWGRTLHENVWANYLCKTAWEVLGGYQEYRQIVGLVPSLPIRSDPDVVVVSDVRFSNEIRILQEAGGKIWRVIRPGLAAPAGGIEGHASERMSEIPAEMFDAVVENTGTVLDLETKVLSLFAEQFGLEPLTEDA